MTDGNDLNSFSGKGVRFVEFFMSGETDGRFGDKLGNLFRRSLAEVESTIKEFVKERSYGPGIEDLAVIPIIIRFDEDLKETEWFKERKYISRKNKSADFRLRIDYERFLSGTDQTRRLLLIRNVIDSIRLINKRMPKEFIGEILEADILNLFKLTKTEIDVF